MSHLLAGGTVTESLRQVRARRRSPNPPHIGAIAHSAAETPERWVAPGSRRGSHGEERRHPLLTIRRSCSAVSTSRCQAAAPQPFCSHGYEFPEPNPCLLGRSDLQIPVFSTSARRPGHDAKSDIPKILSGQRCDRGRASCRGGRGRVCTTRDQLDRFGGKYSARRGPPGGPLPKRTIANAD